MRDSVTIIREVDIDGSKEFDQTVPRGKGGGRGQILLGEGELRGDPGKGGLILSEGRGCEGGAAGIPMVGGEGVVGVAATSTLHREGGQQGQGAVLLIRQIHVQARYDIVGDSSWVGRIIRGGINLINRRYTDL